MHDEWVVGNRLCRPLGTPLEPVAMSCVGRRQDAWRLPAKTSAQEFGNCGHDTCNLPLVQLGGMTGKIGTHFPFEARLTKITAADRHGAAIDLHHKAATRTIREYQTENKIGNKTDFAQHSVLRNLHVQRKSISRISLP